MVRRSVRSGSARGSRRPSAVAHPPAKMSQYALDASGVRSRTPAVGRVGSGRGPRQTGWVGALAHGTCTLQTRRARRCKRTGCIGIRSPGPRSAEIPACTRHGPREHSLCVSERRRTATLACSTAVPRRRRRRRHCRGPSAPAAQAARARSAAAHPHRRSCSARVAQGGAVRRAR